MSYVARTHSYIVDTITLNLGIWRRSAERESFDNQDDRLFECAFILSKRTSLNIYCVCVLGGCLCKKAEKRLFSSYRYESVARARVCVRTLDTETFEAEHLTKDALYRIMDKISLKYANIPKP